MNSISRAVGRRHSAALFCAGLLVLLTLLFLKSFLPNFVVFSNDVPLGLRASEYMRTASPTGAWDDLNSIGKNGGTLTPNLTTFLHAVLSPVVFAKWYPPIALFFLGVGAWCLFRMLRLSPLACVLGSLAAALNSTYFSAACWGVGTQCVAYGFAFLALGVLVNAKLGFWPKVILAGFAVGLGVTEGFDIGAIFSVWVAFFAAYLVLVSEDGSSVARKVTRASARVALMALFALFIAAQAVTMLINTQIKGIVGTQQNASTKAEQWDKATQWSLPKAETLGLIVPGLFGYRMDTPKDMEFFSDWFRAGNYWGAMGRDPAWDRYFANREKGPTPGGWLRQSGGGCYLGVLVALIALWSAGQAFRKNSVFTSGERKLLWFWIGTAVVALLLAFGRFAPFYKLLYLLPYASTMRNPAKFVTVFTFAVIILFAYGIHGLSRSCLSAPLAAAAGLGARLNRWWTRAGVFEKRWILGCLGATGASLVGWLIYASSSPSLERYMQKVGFDEASARVMADFSVHQVAWFILFLVLGVASMVLIFSGALAGRRARWAGVLLGVLLVADLGRADLPWIIYWNYKDKNASNPIVDLLRNKPYEHRVAILPFNPPPQFALFCGPTGLYRIEWAQHQFPYYNIQSLDIVQMPRMPEDLAAFEAAMATAGTPNTLHLLTRRWELTNTKYLLGPAGFLNALNQELDPVRHRFRIVTTFNVVPRPGVTRVTQLEDLTAEPAANGAYALFEFTGALPRARLYSHWQVATNQDPAALTKWVQKAKDQVPVELAQALAGQSKVDLATLKELASTGFLPDRTVLLAHPLPVASPSGATNSSPGTVEYTSYEPKDIKLKTDDNADAVLLLNDKYNSDWRVRVDGKPASLLRCNFVMRGVYLPAGRHTVEFRFRADIRMMYVSLAAVALGIGLLAFLAIPKKAEAAPEPSGKGLRSRPQAAKPAAGASRTQ